MTTSTTTTIAYCRVDDLEWVPDSTDTAVLQPKSDRPCVWRRFTRSEARDLLNGRHLLFTGDSTVSYQYLAMVMYLHEGVSIGDDGPKEWMLYPQGSLSQNYYNSYYEQSSAVFGVDEFCDCYRDVTCHPLCDPQSHVQARYYRFGTDSYVSVVPSAGNIITPRGHSMDFDNWALNCPSLPCNQPADWEEPYQCYIDVLSNLIQRLTPDILVQGVEGHIMQPYDWLIDLLGSAPDREGTFCGLHWLEFSAEVTKQLGDTYGGTRGKPLILTRSNGVNRTTMMSVYNNENGNVLPTNISYHPVVMYDVDYLTKLLATPPLRGYPHAMMKDEVHFAPWVYFELNMWLLNLIWQRQQ